MAVTFLGVLIVFTVSSLVFQQFRVSTSQTAFTSSLMMSGPNSPNLNPLDYEVWGNAGVLTKAATEPKPVPEFKKCTSVNLVCVTGASH